MGNGEKLKFPLSKSKVGRVYFIPNLDVGSSTKIVQM